MIRLKLDAVDDPGHRPRALARYVGGGDLGEEKRQAKGVLIFFGQRIVIVGAAKDVVVAQVEHVGRRHRRLQRLLRGGGGG